MADSRQGTQLLLDPDTLRPLVEQVVEMTLARVADQQAKLPSSRIALSEEEAARAIGVESHVLRDARLRGELSYSRITGRRIRYQISDLIEYLVRRRGC